MRFEFVVRSGKEAGRTVAVNSGQTISVGRLKGCDVAVDDEAARVDASVEAPVAGAHEAQVAEAHGAPRVPREPGHGLAELRRQRRHGASEWHDLGGERRRRYDRNNGDSEHAGVDPHSRNGSPVPHV